MLQTRCRSDASPRPHERVSRYSVGTMTISTEEMSRLSALGLGKEPVAIAFTETPPEGVEHVGAREAAGCGYWRLAADGRSFYTTADDHANCPVGAFTHGVALSAEQSKELEGLIGTMIELKYIRSEEVPAFPHRKRPMRFAVYAPVQRATFAPDVVVFRGSVREMMIVSEAARAAGVFDAAPVMGRPACAMLPHALETATGVASVGCIGNRVYTQLGDGEMYVTVPGGSLSAVLAQLPVTLTANRELEQFHRQRASALA
jgi:uncharacterized protein (DUF169 family)